MFRLEEIPSGTQGLHFKVGRIRALVEAAKRDPAFRARVLRIVANVREKDHLGEVGAIARWVQSRVRYVRDPIGVELFQTPAVMLDDVDSGCAAGDCDDHVILTSAMLETVGYPTRYRVGAVGPEDFRHIWLEVNVPHHGWMPLELTRTDDPAPLGWDPAGRFDHTLTLGCCGVPGLGAVAAPAGSSVLTPQMLAQRGGSVVGIVAKLASGQRVTAEEASAQVFPIVSSFVALTGFGRQRDIATPGLPSQQAAVRQAIADRARGPDLVRALSARAGPTEVRDTMLQAARDRRPLTAAERVRAAGRSAITPQTRLLRAIRGIDTPTDADAQAEWDRAYPGWDRQAIIAAARAHPEIPIEIYNEVAAQVPGTYPVDVFAAIARELHAQETAQREADAAAQRAADEQASRDAELEAQRQRLATLEQQQAALVTQQQAVLEAALAEQERQAYELHLAQRQVAQQQAIRPPAEADPWAVYASDPWAGYAGSTMDQSSSYGAYDPWAGYGARVSYGELYGIDGMAVSGELGAIMQATSQAPAPPAPAGGGFWGAVGSFVGGAASIAAPIGAAILANRKPKLAAQIGQGLRIAQAALPMARGILPTPIGSALTTAVKTTTSLAPNLVAMASQPIAARAPAPMPVPPARTPAPQPSPVPQRIAWPTAPPIALPPPPVPRPRVIQPPEGPAPVFQPPPSMPPFAQIPAAGPPGPPLPWPEPMLAPAPAPAAAPRAAGILSGGMPLLLLGGALLLLLGRR